MLEKIKPFMDALKIYKHHYISYGDYSVTTLLCPPRQVILKQRYGDQTERGPRELISAFIGNGVHSYFERCLRTYAYIDPDYEVERRIIDKINDRLISGQYDILYQQRHMYDIKTCSVWKHIFDPDHKEWTEQQNIYAYMLHRRGVDIESLNIIAIYMDWNERMKMRDPQYPRERIEEVNLPLWSWADTRRFLWRKIDVLKSCEELPDDQLPACTAEEMWEDPTTYAIMKNPKARRAYRVLGSLEEARDVAKRTKGITSASFIEERLSKRKRCDRWCEVNGWCTQYEEYAKVQKRGGVVKHTI